MWLLKQAQNAPIPVEEQVCIIYTGLNGYLDDIEVADLKVFVNKLRNFFKEKTPSIMRALKKEKKLSEKTRENLKKAIVKGKKYINKG